MIKTLTYGFTITDANGKGFTRWHNDKVEFIQPTNLTDTINRVYVAQHVLIFKTAFAYCRYAASEHNLKFEILDYLDFKLNNKTKTSWLRKLIALCGLPNCKTKA